MKLILKFILSPQKLSVAKKSKHNSSPTAATVKNFESNGGGGGTKENKKAVEHKTVFSDLVTTRINIFASVSAAVRKVSPSLFFCRN